MDISYKLPNTKSFEDTIDGKKTHLFTLKNRAGMEIALTDYGARLVSALVPDKHGNLVDVVLGFDSIQGYLHAQEKYHGATVGRFANRIANGKFILDEQEYTLSQNNGNNCLHGGPTGFHTKVWDRQVSFRKSITFYYVSPHNEEGFPGEVNASVKYELTDANEIVINFRATSDRKTIINLTNHAYFNLNGEGNGDVLNHLVQINSNQFIAINDSQIPTGTLESVVGTAFDFRHEKKISTSINDDNLQIQYSRGFDHSFINENALSQVAAYAYSEESGVQLETHSDYPTVHFYSGNYLSDDQGKSGNKYLRNGGLCFEAQHYLDNPNQSQFPSITVEPNQDYNYTIIYKFGIRK